MTLLFMQDDDYITFYILQLIRTSRAELRLTAKMETWFWILGWFLSFLTITGDGFTIFLVCSRRNLRTKTNAFIVSLAVADFCVGLIVMIIPSMFFFFGDITKHLRPASTLAVAVLGKDFTRCLFSNTSVVNLCVLVLDHFIAIVHPLEYITFMTPTVELPKLLSAHRFSQLVLMC